MRIRVNVDDCFIIFEAFYAEYDVEMNGVLFFTLDGDQLWVKMDPFDWSAKSGVLLEYGYLDLICYTAEYIYD